MNLTDRWQADYPWFAGEADIPTYSPEEMLATKLRALLQRDKGRDLLDLAHGLGVFDALDSPRVSAIMQRYLTLQEMSMSRAQAEKRMFAKLAKPGFVADVRPLLSAEDAERLTDDSINAAFMDVFTAFVSQISGKPWARTEEMLERFGLVS